MASFEVTAGNVEIITDQLAQIMFNINHGNGTLGKLIMDSTIAHNVDQTMENLQKSSRGLNENMNAAKQNFLLRGYYKKKAKAAEKAKEEAADKAGDDAAGTKAE